MSQGGLNVAILGATGAVGEEMRRALEESSLRIGELRLLASERSAGARLEWRGDELTVRPVGPASFDGIDLALFSAGGGVSLAHAPVAVNAGAVVIDNSSAFRMDAGVPLVVPEVNPEAARTHGGIIANPNCSTIQVVMALAPLHAEFGLERVVASTYQSASGAGRAAMDELRDQTIALLNFQPAPVKRFSRRLAFDVIPQVDDFLDDGSTKEERKLVDESRKIMGLAGLRVSATCVRVPVFVGHCVSLNVQFRRPPTVAAARAALAKFPGVEVVDEDGTYPTNADVAGDDLVKVGRLRLDPSADNAMNLWVAADNLRKGAATNAVQIAELIWAQGQLAK